jgi:hypothetical protein
MSRLTRRNWLACALMCALSPLPLAGAAAYGQETPSSAAQSQEDFLEYRLRAGESLSDVAHLFRIPLEELVQVNHIADPTRLAVGQPLKVPNVFARQAAQLQGERDRLLAEKEQGVNKIKEMQQTAAATEGHLHTAEAEKAALTRRLASTVHWRRGALALTALLLGVAGWCLKLWGEQVSLARKLASLIEENTALTVTKDKYRQTAAQLELRYQKLYRSREEVPAKFLAEGTAILAQTFDKGCAQLEHLLTRIRAEKEREARLLQGDQPKATDLLLHPLRELLHRAGLNTIRG